MSKIITDVPEGWKIQRLKSVCKLRKRTKLPPLKEIANIPMNLIPEDGIYVNFIMKSIDDIKSGDICKEGDILLAGITPSFENGKQGIVPPLPSKYAITTTEAFPLICGSNVESHFVFYLLKYEFTRRIIASRMEGSTGRQRVPSDVLMKFQIPVPPLVEQRGIVEVLGTVDECIRLTDAVIERAEELTRGLMQKLLTRGIGHTDYKESDVGLIPSNWEVVKLSDLAYVKRGASPRPITDPKYWSQKGRGWVRINDVTSSYNYLRKTTQYLTKYGASKSVEVNPGDVIMSICATIGKPIILDMEACIHDGFVTFKNLSNKIRTDFLYYFLLFKEPYFLSKRQVGTQGNINSTIVGNTKIGLPYIKEQDDIIRILNDVSTYLSLDVSRKNTLIELKKGLMQSLLSGKSRVELKEDGLHRIEDSREANN